MNSSVKSLWESMWESRTATGSSTAKARGAAASGGTRERVRRGPVRVATRNAPTVISQTATSAGERAPSRMAYAAATLTAKAPANRRTRRSEFTVSRLSAPRIPPALPRCRSAAQNRFEAPREDLVRRPVRDVDAPEGIEGDPRRLLQAFGGPGPQRNALDVVDSAARSPRVGDEDDVRGADGDVGLRIEIHPARYGELPHEDAGRIEHLDPVIARVGDIDLPGGIDREPDGLDELARPAPVAAEFVQTLAVAVEADDLLVSGIGDVNELAGYDDRAGAEEQVVRGADHFEKPAVRRRMDDAGIPGVRDPQVPRRVDRDPARLVELAVAGALRPELAQELPVPVEELDAAVLGVGHVQRSTPVRGDAAGLRELTRGVARTAPCPRRGQNGGRAGVGSSGRSEE